MSSVVCVIFFSDDFRVFCGDLGNEVTDDTLARAFNKYPSFLKAKVVRDKRSMKTKGFGFVSFKVGIFNFLPVVILFALKYAKHLLPIIFFISTEMKVV